MAEVVLNAIVKQKRDTTANWESNNPILPNGLFGIEITDEGKYKLKAGDGETAWNDLEYLSGGGSGIIPLTYEAYVSLFDEGELDPDNTYEVALSEDEYQTLVDTNRIPTTESGLIVHFYTEGEEVVPIIPVAGGGYSDNLLINSNFIINQRGKSEYNNVGYYCVDRWILDSTAYTESKLTVLPDGGVTVEPVDGDFFGVFQILENNLNVGEKYIVTVKIDGVIYSTPLTGGEYNNDGIKLDNSEFYIFYTNIHQDADTIYVRAYSNTVTSMTIDWVKLEIGSAFTSYVAPNPWQELMKCGVPDDTNKFGYAKRVVDADKIGGVKANEVARANGIIRQASVGYDGYIAYPEVEIKYPNATGIIGRLKIVLPLYFQDTMIKFKVSIFSFKSHCSVDYIVSGHLENDDLSWQQVSAVAIGDKMGDNINLPVYFGHDGANAIVFIGDFDTYWNHPHVRITDVTAGYSNFSYDLWRTGWSVDFVKEDTSTIDRVVEDTWINSAVNPNLIFNPDFKINQRGLTTYLQGNTYCVDRWRCNLLTGDRVVVTGDGLSLTAANPASHKAYLSQFIERSLIKPGIYTLTFCVDGVIYSKTGTLSESGTKFTILDIENLICGLNYDASKGAYRIYIQTTELRPTFTVNWVKLEPGRNRTAFVVPDPALELIRCQRYYRELTGEFTYTRSGSSRGFYAFIVSIPVMRVIPTVTYVGTLNDVNSIFNAEVVAGNMKNTITSITLAAYNEASQEMYIRCNVLLKDTASMAIAATTSNEMLVVRKAGGAKIICNAEIA